MPLDLRNIIENESTVTVRSEIYGVEFEIAYSPIVYEEVRGEIIRVYAMAESLRARSVEDLGREYEAAEQELKQRAAQVLARLIKRWDITFDGEPVPITVETLSGEWRRDEGYRFPMEFLFDMMRAVVNDRNPNRSA